jgi:hypothetical protein
VSTRAGLELAGSLGAVGSDWLLVEDAHGRAWFVPVAEVVMVAGLVARSVPEQARPLESRLSLRSVLRRLSEERQPCAIHLAAGRVLHGVLTRVGADFVEVRETESADRVVVPLGAIAALQERV